MSVFDAYCELQGALLGTVLCDERMSRHTTYHLGGPADLYIECASYADLKLSLDTLRRHDIPWAVLGKGSNLLVADEGVRSALIVLGSEFKSMHMPEEGLLVAGAGVPLASIVQEAFKNAYSGFEFAVGIPGTLGGALFMNAGTRREWIASSVESVTLYSQTQGLIKIPASQLPWSYRCSGIPSGDIILEAELRVKSGDPAIIRAKMEESLRRRKARQPLSLPSAGSVFRNPPDDSAGRLIESVGLKGHRIGGAQISELHSNFIVNLGNARSQDVLDLIVLARDRVKEEHGIELRPEVRFLGF